MHTQTQDYAGPERGLEHVSQPLERAMVEITRKFCSRCAETPEVADFLCSDCIEGILADRFMAGA